LKPRALFVRKVRQSIENFFQAHPLVQGVYAKFVRNDRLQMTAATRMTHDRWQISEGFSARVDPRSIALEKLSDVLTLESCNTKFVYEECHHYTRQRGSPMGSSVCSGTQHQRVAVRWRVVGGANASGPRLCGRYAAVFERHTSAASSKAGGLSDTRFIA
jgi:hypothetical protein